MYSDDPGKEGTLEHKLGNQINEFRNKYSTEEFGLIQTQEDVFKIFNLDRTIQGTIDLRSRNADIQ